MDEMKQAQPPVLERLAALEERTDRHNGDVAQLVQRLTWLETRLSSLLGADCQWSPPPQTVDSPVRLNRIR